MHQKIIEKIIEESKNGNYQLIENIVSNLNETLLVKSIPDDMKEDILDGLVGQPIYVIINFYKDGTKDHIESVDEVEAMCQYHMISESGDLTKIQLIKCLITGKLENQWEYELSTGNIISEDIFDTRGMDGQDFEATLTYKLTGKTEPDFSNDDLTDFLQYITPCVFNRSIMNPKIILSNVKIEYK